MARQIVIDRCPGGRAATRRRQAVNVAIVVVALCAACGRARSGNPCEQKLVGQADVAGIMTSPVVKTEALEGPPGTAAAGAQQRLGELCNTIFSRR